MRSPSYIWAEDYEAAVLEVDSGRLKAKIAEAETTIERRKAELLHNHLSSSDELEAIARASQVLSILKGIAQKHS